MREKCVVVLHERVRRERERRDLEPSRARPLIERLDVREHLLALEPPGVHPVDGERPVHERVVGIWAVSDADPHEGEDASTAFSLIP